MAEELARYRVTNKWFNPFTGDTIEPGCDFINSYDERVTDEVELPCEPPILYGDAAKAAGVKNGERNLNDHRHEPNLFWEPLNMAAVMMQKKVLDQKLKGQGDFEALVEQYGGNQNPRAREMAADETIRRANQTNVDFKKMAAGLDEYIKGQKKFEESKKKTDAQKRVDAQARQDANAVALDKQNNAFRPNDRSVTGR